MKNKFIRWVLMLLGVCTMVVGCEPNSGGTGGGSSGDDAPYADYEISGVVLDINKNPIKDIRVKAIRRFSSLAEMLYANVQTDEQGRYTLSFNIPSVYELTINTKDIDGEDNGGEFIFDEVTFKILEGEFIGGNDESIGKYTKEVNFELEKGTIRPVINYTLGEEWSWVETPDDNLNVIRSASQFAEFVTSDDIPAPTDIDFEEKTLLLVTGTSQMGFERITKTLIERETDYIYIVNVYIGGTNTDALEPWRVAILAPAIPTDISVQYEINYLD